MEDERSVTYMLLSMSYSRTHFLLKPIPFLSRIEDSCQEHMSERTGISADSTSAD